MWWYFLNVCKGFAIFYLYFFTLNSLTSCLPGKNIADMVGEKSLHLQSTTSRFSCNRKSCLGMVCAALSIQAQPFSLICLTVQCHVIVLSCLRREPVDLLLSRESCSINKDSSGYDVKIFLNVISFESCVAIMKKICLEKVWNFS